MHRRKVLWLFVLESALLGLGGCAAGALLASLIAGGLNAADIAVPEGIQLFLMQEHLSFRLATGAVVGDVLLLSLITIIASVFPAIRAARLKPVTAMHHVG
jgi:ABC-type lipoprotein release transport system permease subunit